MGSERTLNVKDRPWLERALDYLYVPNCPGCGRLAIYGLCYECLEQVQPLSLQLNSGLIVYVGGFYEGSLKKAILTLKKLEQTYLSYAVVRLLLRALPVELGRRPFYCLPIPANYERLRRRGFYGPSLFVKELLRQLPNWCKGQNLLTQKRSFQVQKLLGRRERFQNVEEGYLASAAIQGKSIILVDDVVTTGATLTEAALALVKGGAREVIALAAAASVNLRKADTSFKFLVPNKLEMGS